LTATETENTHRREGPNLDSLYMIAEDGSQKKIHPADVRGRFQRRKKVMWALLIAIYVVMPWVKIGGHPAILVDIVRRQFFLFGQTFNAQDFYLAFFWITGLAFGLYVISSLWGRLWCGYACPHTVFLEAIFRKIERTIEGNRSQREKLTEAPWTGSKILKRGSKWGAFLIVSALLSHTFLSYFMPVETVFRAVVSPPSEHPTAFTFILVFTGIIYFNFAWFREQLCIIVCPYGRFQSVLYDEHTVNVGFDRQRGEPRGHHNTEGRGDCIDCFRCVQVCPTGIDIRNGTQLECIGCANCIDACDEVMHKIDQEPGLVRYDSQAGFANRVRRLVRPRTILYTVLLLLGLAVFLSLASGRQTFEAQLLRGNGPPYTVSEGLITNLFTLHLVNKGGETATFEIESQDAGVVEQLFPIRKVVLESFADRRVPVIARVPLSRYDGRLRVAVVVRVGDERRELSSPLLGPK
jgi:cytochrome c oxidase accessory protein FixG